jgi:GNAT superfamily N-acetyltransferase
MKFKRWFEEEEQSFNVQETPNGYIVRYLEKDYKSDVRYQKPPWRVWPNEVGRVEIDRLKEMPDYLFVVSSSVAEDRQRQGIGSLLYNRALQVAKEKGYKGIVSDKTGRSLAAGEFWKKLNPRSENEFDVLEVCHERQQS